MWAKLTQFLILTALISSCGGKKKMNPEDFWGMCLEITDLRDERVQPILEDTVYEPHVDFHGGSGDSANFLSDALWRVKKIPVCWEDPDPNFEQEQERQRVRYAVERTWNSVLDGYDIADSERLEFVGWGVCNGNNDGIRIKVRDEGPHVKTLGRYLKNRAEGMVLNFTFKNWSTSCAKTEVRRMECIDYIAVHEFGHALGMAHEHNRIDTPESCAQDAQGADGDIYIGEWDKESVMNYCSSRWINDGQLTTTDIIGIRSVYAPTINEAFCEDTLDLANQELEAAESGVIAGDPNKIIDLSGDIKSED